MPRMEDLLAEGQGLIETGGAIVAANLVTDAEFTAANIVAEFTGTPTGTKFLRDDGTLAAVAAQGLLAATEWNPGTEVYVGSTSTTYADISATNLAVTFTAPASGAVVVRADVPSVVSAATPLGLNLRTAAGDVAGSAQRASYAETSNTHTRLTYSKKMSGLTPGTSYTYKLGIARQGGTGSAQVAIGGATFGAAVMTVEAA